MYKYGRFECLNNWSCFYFLLPKKKTKQITEIIWGEPEDHDEHIVPYPECREGIISFPLGELNKKSSLQDSNNNAVNGEENVKSEVKNDVTGVKLEASDYGAEEELSTLGFDLTWSNLVPANTDSDARDSMGTEAFTKFTSMANFNLEEGHTATGFSLILNSVFYIILLVSFFASCLFPSLSFSFYCYL